MMVTLWTVMNTSVDANLRFFLTTKAFHVMIEKIVRQTQMFRLFWSNL